MNSLRILITFALEAELVEQIRAVAPDRIEIDVLGQDQRRLLRGFKYPSEREREAVAEGCTARSSTRTSCSASGAPNCTPRSATPRRNAKSGAT